MRHLPRFVLIALLLVYVVWGSTYFAIRVGLESFPPLLMIALRFLVAGLLLFGAMKWRGAANPTVAQWRDGGIVGILLLGGGTGFVAIAEQSVASGLTAVFIAITPLLFALWSGWFGHWPTRREWVGIGIGFAGVLLLASGAGLSGSPLGALTLLCAVTCWSLGSVLSQKKLKVAPGPMGFASEMIVGGAFLLLVGLLKGEALSADILAQASWQAWLAWFYLITIGSLVGFSAYMYTLARVSPALASSYAYVNPVIAVALGVWLGGEIISTREVLAMAVILISVMLLTTAPRKAAA
ncbi:MAG TPA: drug/metabolite exporter YedA [Burkholderiaceae bacterium]|nr:drug/metabolite exporter YedA [Burkholderiaceae bacterium]